MKINGTDTKKSSGAKGGKILSAFCSVIGTIGLVVIILLCLPVTIPGFIGYNIYNVETGSMEPTMPVGSICYVKGIAGTEIKQGDIIAFNAEGMTVTHRVISNDTSAMEVKTKGDANEAEDPMPVRYGEIIGRVVLHLPYLGKFFVFFTGLQGKLYLFGVLAGCVVLMLVGSTIRDRIKKASEESDPYDDDYDDDQKEQPRKSPEKSSYGYSDVKKAIARYDENGDFIGVPTVSAMLGLSESEGAGDAKNNIAKAEKAKAEKAKTEKAKSERTSGGMSRRKGLIITLSIVLGVVLLGALGMNLADALIKKGERDAYDDINEFVKDNSEPAKEEKPAPVEEPAAIEEEPEEDVVRLNGPLDIDFEELMSINPDVCGWIYCPETVINYPILKDNNNDYYLHHNYKGDYTASGSIFIECLNRDDFADCNTIIYGHHMADGSMFASLSKWFKQDYYEAHPIMYVFTPTQNYVLQLFSAYTTAATSDSYWAAQTPCQEMTDYTAKVASQSEFDPGEIDLPDDGHYVMLSTCAYSFQDARSVLHGLLVPMEEWIPEHEDEVDWEVKEYEPYIYEAPEAVEGDAPKEKDTND